MSTDLHLVVNPEDGLCEGCAGPIGDDPRETDDMIVLCRACWDICVDESKYTDAVKVAVP